jgi:hypothetical protein
MKINYKFNKSIESRDCVVESVELEILVYTLYKKLTLQTFTEALNNAKESKDNFLIGGNKGEGICKQLESLYKQETKQFTS